MRISVALGTLLLVGLHSMDVSASPFAAASIASAPLPLPPFRAPAHDDVEPPAPPPPRPQPRPKLDWSRLMLDDGNYVVVERAGGRIELTLDPKWQRAVERALEDTKAPVAAAVILGLDRASSQARVLALAGRTGKHEREADALALVTTPWAPAASIFKLVTAAALVERGVSPEERVCYHAGVHSVEASNLVSHPKWDDACQSLAFGVAKSQNAIIARLANDNLDAATLERTARALGFGSKLTTSPALPVELGVSQLDVPRGDALAFARVSAGFWRSTLSPLHGAILAATIANGGVTPSVRLVEKAITDDDRERRPDAAPPRRALPESVARAVGQMMVGTTDYGTARLGFHDRGGRPVLPGLPVAGKTGSLFRRGDCATQHLGPHGCEGDFLAYSWFVGFAPADKPEVAFAVLVGNGEDWHKKAHQVAAEVLQQTLRPASPNAATAVARAHAPAARPTSTKPVANAAVRAAQVARVTHVGRASRVAHPAPATTRKPLPHRPQLARR
jgi:cell division protein FtsI/penicillin-binding protein 2